MTAPHVPADRRTPRALGLDPGLEQAGFNVAGVLARERYDALVPQAWRSPALLPGAGAALVLGCGGRAFGEAFARSPEARAASHPLDRFTARVVREAATAHARTWGATRGLFYWERRGGVFADLVALGRECGLGVPGRLGVLLHPTYGPWMSLRAILLTAARLEPTAPLRDFEPCRGCPAPCARACPGGAVGALAFDTAACLATTRVHAPCREACAARRACVLGPDHAYPPALERRYRAAVVREAG